MELKVVTSEELKFVKPAWLGNYEGAASAYALETPDTDQMSAGLIKCGAGFSLEETFSYEEINYLTDGSMVYTCKGETFIAEKGDFVAIPNGATVTMTTHTGCEILFITYPHLKKVRDKAKLRMLSSGKRV